MDEVKNRKKVYDKEYYDNHKEQLIEYATNYYNNHKEHSLERKKERYEDYRRYYHKTRYSKHKNDPPVKRIEFKEPQLISFK